MERHPAPVSSRVLPPVASPNSDPELTLADALELYMFHQQSLRYTAKTIKSATSALNQFVRYAGNPTLSEITPTLLRNFSVYTQDRGVSSAYHHGIFKCLRALCNFLVEEELLAFSPMKKVKMPRLQFKVKSALSADEVARVLAACETLRDKAILHLILASGLRREEVCKLRVSDVDLLAKTIHVRIGKGQKGRLGYIDSMAAKAIKKYLLTRRNPHSEDPLFESMQSRGAFFQPDGLTLLFRRLRIASGVENLTCHALRRTFATNAARAGMPLPMLARVLGHADLESLRNYIAIDDRDAAEAYRAAFA